MSEREQLQQAIEMQEKMRGTVPDGVIDAALNVLRQRLAELDTPVVEESQRKQVAILFADVSGFTELSENLDAEDVREMINVLWGGVDGAITAHGGHIDKHIGDAVMALWGVGQAQEDDVEQAIRAGLAIQTAVAEFCAARNVTLSLRVGVNSGMVILGQVGTTGEFTAMGDAVNVASRLEHAAPPGGILISHDAYRHVRGLFELVHQAPLTVKGKSEPLQTYLVRGLRPRAFRLGNRGVEGLETDMIGRAAEFRQLQDRLHATLSEKAAHLVTIVGDAGLGKSRLLFEFDKWLDAETNATLFKGRADYQRQGMPFALVRDLFHFRYQILDSDSPEEALAKLESGFVDALGDEPGRPAAHFLAHLLGLDMNRSPFVGGILSDARQIRARAFGYVAAYFNALAAQCPVVVLLEDIHWADTSSLDLIEHLGRECPHIPLMVVANARPSLFERRAEWGSGWGNALRLDLQPLSKEDSRALIAHILRKIPELPQVLAETIAANAEGNPFYVEELIKMLIDQGVILAGEERWQVVANELTRLKIPPTLTGILQARLDRLASEERRMMQRAAVVGRIFWDEAVAYLAELREGDEIKAERSRLGELQGKELVFRRAESAFEGADEYIMKHAILHEVTYETVLKKYRANYHQRAAEWLAHQPQADTFAGLIAKHYERAGDEPEMAKWYVRAGQMAEANYALDDAIVYYQKAMEPNILDSVESLKIQRSMGKILTRQAKYEDAGEIFRSVIDLARKVGDHPTEAIGWSQLSIVEYALGNPQESLKCSEQAEQIWLKNPSQDVVAFAAVMEDKGWAYYSLGDLSSAATAAEKSLTLCGNLENARQQKARTLNLFGAIQYSLGNLDTALAYFEQCLALNRELGNQFAEAEVLNNLGEVTFVMGNYVQSKPYLETALALFQKFGFRHHELACSANNAAVLIELGQVDLAIAKLEKLSKELPADWYLSSDVYRFLGQAYLQNEQLEQALSQIQQGWQHARKNEMLEHEAHAWRLLGVIAGKLNRSVTCSPDDTALYDARACFEKSIEIFRKGGMEVSRAAALKDWAIYEYRQGNREQAPTRYQEARAIFEGLNLPLWVEKIDAEWAALDA